MSEFQPLISVVIPTYQRPRQLLACLKALACQNLNTSDFEVVIIDDDGGADPGLASAVAQVAQDLEIMLIAADHRGPAAARNRGAEVCKGRLLAFTDDDCEPQADWLQRLLEVFDRSPETVVGGAIRCGLEKNRYSAASQDLVRYLYEYFNRIDGQARLIVSNNLALAKSVFDRLDGFDLRFKLAAAEDRDFSHRCTTLGIKMVFEPLAIVVHNHELTAWSFVRQHFTYGLGAYHYHQSCAADGRGNIPMEPMRFYHDLVFYPLRHGRPTVEAIIGSILLVVSQAANAAGYFWEKLRS